MNDWMSIMSRGLRSTMSLRTVSRDLRDLRPRDQIDIQSFIWVQGSDEY